MTTEHQRERQERFETFENDRKVREQTGTFMSHTHIDDAGGRFAQVNAATVIGAKPAVASAYPACSRCHQKNRLAIASTI